MSVMGPPLLAFGDVVEVFDDGGDGGDSAEDGEYWDHSESPLLRFCFVREFPGHTAICKTRAKRKMHFLSENRRVEK